MRYLSLFPKGFRLLSAFLFSIKIAVFGWPVCVLIFCFVVPLKNFWNRMRNSYFDCSLLIALEVSFYDSKRNIGILQVSTTRRGILVFYRFLRLEEEYWYSSGFYDSKRNIGILQVSTTRGGILVFFRFLRLEEEYWYSTGFYDSRRNIGILQVSTTRRGMLVFYRFLRLEEEYWYSTGFLTKVMLWTFAFCFPTLTSVLERWLVFEQLTLKV